MSTTDTPSGPCLLVVDDDPDMLRLLSMRLTAAGYRVLAVTSAESALNQLALERPALVLSDVQLPGKDGLALFDAVRAQHPSLPVILLTAHGTIPDAVEATARGVFGYLTKPFDGKALLEKISQALAVSAPPTCPAAGAKRTGAARSSAAQRAWKRCWPKRVWWPSPTPACCCAATAVPARSCWPAPSTRPARAPKNPSWR